MILTVFESDIPHQISYGNYTGFDKKKKKLEKEITNAISTQRVSSKVFEAFTAIVTVSLIFG